MTEQPKSEPSKSLMKQKLNEDLKKAMRQGDKTKVSAIRLLMNAIKYAEIAKQCEFGDDDIFVVIGKEIKQRRESIEAFKQGNRQDLVAKEEAELAILQTYLPAQASREEIIAAARKVIEEVGASGPRDKGKVMPKLIAQFKGKAEGREISDIVNELLGS